MNPNKHLTAILCVILTILLSHHAWGAPSDIDVVSMIERAFLNDDVVFANDLDIRSEDGVVTLSGRSGSFLEKRRAESLAKSREGVRSVINRIQVDPSENSDAKIKADVKAALAYSDEITTQEINVAVTYGVVTLSGVAFGWAHHNKAALTASVINGVSDVRNELTVNWDAERSDTEIQQHIAKRLRYDLWIDDTGVKVDVAGGKVRLSGSVPTLEDKERAYDQAWVLGVADVNAKGVYVASSASDTRRRKKMSDLTDTEIQEVLSDAFTTLAGYRGDTVNVAATNGAVTLSGKVGTLHLKDLLGSTAKNTIGVIDVSNHLKVRPQREIGDDVLKKNVIAAIQRHAHLEAYDIDVHVKRGRVKLTGEVDFFYDKQEAGIVAASAGGAKEVSNKITHE
jgi:hyperosmotically inducible protein